MACSANPTIISTPPLAWTSYMMSRTHVQKGITAKNLHTPKTPKTNWSMRQNWQFQPLLHWNFSHQFRQRFIHPAWHIRQPWLQCHIVTHPNITTCNSQPPRLLLITPSRRPPPGFIHEGSVCVYWSVTSRHVLGPLQDGFQLRTSQYWRCRRHSAGNLQPWLPSFSEFSVWQTDPWRPNRQRSWLLRC